jgi:ribulose bisphosphate carboxylase small subunit
MKNAKQILDEIIACDEAIIHLATKKSQLQRQIRTLVDQYYKIRSEFYDKYDEADKVGKKLEMPSYFSHDRFAYVHNRYVYIITFDPDGDDVKIEQYALSSSDSTP